MSVTLWVLLFTAIFLIVFDVYIIIKKGKQESISAYIIRWWYKNKKTIVLAWLLGLLCGHLGWSMKTSDVYYNVKCEEVKNDIP
jgi:hypothetical protein